ncbi:hypothetical protein PG993_010871 [Apiospora rasikravindrae]|uniref:Uncharacterized protein n=1 Tax=Apiospora rasikravindrae TaxID=990691 RepID=A0ABR1SDV3_9PEZI
MQLTTFALTTASVATTVLAAGAPPITTTTASFSTWSTVSHHSSTHPGTASSHSKPQATGTAEGGGPQQGGRPQVHITVETPASNDACGKATNTTILVPIDGVYTNRTALGKVATLYLTDVTGGSHGPRLEDITCVPYFKENGTGTPAGNAFTFHLPSHLTPVVGTPNHIGSIFCMVPIPAGGKPPGGGGSGVLGGGNGTAAGNNTISVSTPPAPAPTPVNTTVTPLGTPPPPPAQSSQVPASGVEELGVPALMLAALFGVLGIMFTL